MSIDISSENLLTLPAAARTLPSRPHVSTLHRWRLPPGVRGVTLETCLIGGKRFTSLEAIERFVTAVTAAADGNPAPIPYADHLNIPTTKVAARRAFGQLIGCIQAVALLRQFQKEEVTDGCIAADLDDYRVAYKIMLPVLRRAFAPVNQRAVELLAIIRTNVQKMTGSFDRNDCVRWRGISLTEVRNRLEFLLEAGAITLTLGSRGQKCVYKVENDAESHSVRLKELVTPIRSKTWMWRQQ